MLRRFSRHSMLTILMLSIPLAGMPARANAHVWAVRSNAEVAGNDAATQAVPGAPRLHIELTRPANVRLLEITGRFTMVNYRTGFSSGVTSRPVCAAPCDQVIDGRQGQSFIFDGDGIIKSREFSLSNYSGDIVARVKPGRVGLRIGGIITMSLGGAAIGTAGILLLLEGLRSRGPRFDDGQTPEYEPNYLPATALVISGALALAGGLAMVLLSRTRVTWSQRPR
ncbi:hypothetical protein [Nannocystis pusilla]|uniref:Uncharacterized protein n=1 Tax=Nannocystis pusilla TaxID=889268 RepID=A0ABS7TN30_9BACT|nr:hypothetical protein [Nannocystis pusilla]MBZ5709638.1 hypothetical protein [Nannocystis pusilla]